MMRQASVGEVLSPGNAAGSALALRMDSKEESR